MEYIQDKLHSQFILRLPQKEASTISKYLKKKPGKIKKHLKINLNPETRQAEVTVKKKIIPMKLVDLPTITESLKTVNQKVFFKTADICQMLVPELPEETVENNNLLEQGKEDKKYLWPHGLTPPMKNVRKIRFRRTLKNKHSMDSTEIEKEVKWLLRMDNDAVAVRWELIDDPAKKFKIKKIDNHNEVEKEVFGEIISDSDENDEEIRERSLNNSQDTRSEMTATDSD